MNFETHCEAFINDRDLVIVARNAILLLVALYLDTHIATEAVVHIWYSAFMSR